MLKREILVVLVASISVFLIAGNGNIAHAGCDLPGTAHGDNHKSESKGEKMMKDGASACELAKAYDAHEIDFKISQKDMKEYDFYKNADSDMKKDMNEYAKDGHGAPGFVAYELKDVVEEAN